MAGAGGFPRRSLLVGGAALLVGGPAVLAGCAGQPELQQERREPGPDLSFERDALVADLRAGGLAVDADEVEQADTTLHELTTTYLAGWRIVDARRDREPWRAYLGWQPGVGAVHLTGNPAGFSEIFLDRSAGKPPALDEALAVTIAQDFLDTTWHLRTLQHRIASVTDIPWREIVGKGARADLSEQLEPLITPPAATAAGEGFTVELHTISHEVLVRHEVLIDFADGVRDQPLELADRLPVVVAE